ncbi:hypothetical protein PG984_005587 [Apiospora sp. TS-2023a]
MSIHNNIPISKPSRYLFVMFPTMTQFLVWACFITESQDPAWRVETLAVTMGGYAAGWIFLIAVKDWMMVRCNVQDGWSCLQHSELIDWSSQTQIGYLSALFVLEVAVLLTWGIYQWKTDQRARRDRGDGLISGGAMGITG